MRAVLRRRLLPYLTVLLGILLLLAGGVTYWLGVRPLPQTTGTVHLPLHGPGAIRRDAWGVPHIQASTIDDAFYLQGYATAQDRLFQLDALRRLSAGELSEVIGASTLEIDRDARQLRMRRIAEMHAGRMSASDRRTLEAYGNGINAFLEGHRDRLPMEFRLLGYEPRPWKVEDSVLVGLSMFRDMTNSWRDDVRKRDLLAAGDPALVRQLFPARTGKEIQVGSNAWAIGGRHTASGKPLLANDPHLQWSLPAAWYMVDLLAPGLHVTGVSLPGLPAVIIGHNERIAWGCTNLHFDVQDLYLEKIDRVTGETVYNGQKEQARKEAEQIRVKGRAPVTYETWVTRHGPLLTSNSTPLALHWAAAEPEMFQFPFVQINQAGNWKEFTAGLARFPGPGQNFVYADVDGHIGYHAAGRLPIRKGFAGDVPIDGSTSDNDWQGYIPFDQLPQAFDPPSGYIVTANQNPFAAEFPYVVNGNFAPVYRARQIHARLQARDGWTAPELVSVQTDVYADFARDLAQQTVSAWDRKKPGGAGAAQEAVELLRGWNGQMDRESAPALISTLLLEVVRSRLAERAAHSKGTAYEMSAAIPSVEWILAERPAGWFSDYDQLLVDSLQESVSAKGVPAGGPKQWKYGQSLELTIASPVAGRLPLVGRFFNIGPVAMSGSSLTVKQTSKRLGPSMRFVADTADWDRSLMNVTTGESGHPFSRHYRDQWEAYYAGRGLVNQFRQPEIVETLELVP